MPQLHVVNDYTDSTVSTVAQLSEYANYRTYKFNGPKSFKLIPKPSEQFYRTSVSTAYGHVAGRNKSWLDTDYPSVPHWGMKYAVDNINGVAGTQQVVQFKIRKFIYFSCRAVK